MAGGLCVDISSSHLNVLYLTSICGALSAFFSMTVDARRRAPFLRTQRTRAMQLATMQRFKRRRNKARIAGSVKTRRA